MSQLREAAGGDPSSSPTPEVYTFASFRLDVTGRALVRHGQPVPLTPKAFDLFVLLVGQRGHVLSRDTLIQRLWPDTFVEEANLSFSKRWLRASAASHCRRVRSGGGPRSTMPADLASIPA